MQMCIVVVCHVVAAKSHPSSPPHPSIGPNVPTTGCVGTYENRGEQERDTFPFPPSKTKMISTCAVSPSETLPTPSLPNNNKKQYWPQRREKAGEKKRLPHIAFGCNIDRGGRPTNKPIPPPHHGRHKPALIFDLEPHERRPAGLRERPLGRARGVHRDRVIQRAFVVLVAVRHAHEGVPGIV
mmetsp:Transcript_39583/g.77384  ORF Transcript_39583/g.77384 Transcript_39583/m.77384 type:complete len:183 (-) Transcript_39583:441-989(-)